MLRIFCRPKLLHNGTGGLGNDIQHQQIPTLPAREKIHVSHRSRGVTILGGETYTNKEAGQMDDAVLGVCLRNSTLAKYATCHSGFLKQNG